MIARTVADSADLHSCDLGNDAIASILSDIVSSGSTHIRLLSGMVLVKLTFLVNTFVTFLTAHVSPVCPFLACETHLSLSAYKTPCLVRSRDDHLPICPLTELLYERPRLLEDAIIVSYLPLISHGSHALDIAWRLIELSGSLVHLINIYLCSQR